MTIVMVTHDKVRAARYAHRIITMRDGKLVTEGASDEIA
jgi:ABC-type cobalamin/Fe3+-siderophores transport system ATPase subunit